MLTYKYRWGIAARPGNLSAVTGRRGVTPPVEQVRRFTFLYQEYRMKAILRNFLVKLIALAKGIFFLLKPGVYLGFLATPLIFIGNSLKLSKWISDQPRKDAALDDFFRLNRNYEDRFKLHEHVLTTEQIADEKIDYLEFGVAGGTSLEWWLKANTNLQSRFFGFDTFEGLPEDWGLFKKGEMGPGSHVFQDRRCTLVKGLFQKTVPTFLESTSFESTTRKVLHLDADLFSSTLLVLILFASHLKSGDILLFDEFCVPNHEFLAFEIYTRMHNARYEFLGAVNNYLQVALKITN